MTGRVLIVCFVDSPRIDRIGMRGDQAIESLRDRCRFSDKRVDDLGLMMSSSRSGKSLDSVSFFSAFHLFLRSANTRKERQGPKDGREELPMDVQVWLLRRMGVKGSFYLRKASPFETRLLWRRSSLSLPPPGRGASSMRTRGLI